MKNEGKELAASVTVSLPTRFQGVATIQALPLVSSLSLLSLSLPPFCQMFQWSSQPDGETPSPAFSLVFPPHLPSASLFPPCLSLFLWRSVTFPCTIFSLFPSCLPFFLAVSSFPSSLPSQTIHVGGLENKTEGWEDPGKHRG